MPDPQFDHMSVHALRDVAWDVPGGIVCEAFRCNLQIGSECIKYSEVWKC